MPGRPMSSRAMAGRCERIAATADRPSSGWERVAGSRGGHSMAAGRLLAVRVVGCRQAVRRRSRVLAGDKGGPMRLSLCSAALSVLGLTLASGPAPGQDKFEGMFAKVEIALPEKAPAP